MEGEISQNQAENGQLKYWIAFSKIPSIGPVNLKRIADFFVDLAGAWRASSLEFGKAGLEKKLIDEIIIGRTQINPDEELAKMKRENVQAVLITEDHYPKLLKEIFNPPPILYYRGSLEFLTNNCLAVVGTRKFSPYGRRVAEEITADLARSGITIVSGLALGIDSIAHQACLEAGGKTVCVLGSGVDRRSVSPATNSQIGEKIVESGGAIISEYPVHNNPTKQTFPMRNRIVSGLSLGVLVIEAPESSGSLITAKFALDQNRDVFAVPGNIYNRNSQGANDLIKKGAKLVNSADDILSELNLQLAFEQIKNDYQPDNEEEKIIINVLSKEPLHIDKIKQLSKLNINALSSTITLLEIKGIVKDIGGKNYIRK